MREGKYTDYKDLLDFFSRKKKECPKGVTLKLEKQKYLSLQFVFPDTKKRGAKSCNVQFTDIGIVQAVDKAHKVREALDTVKTASEFWDWYNKEILEKNEIESDLKTYRQIFQEIEDEYFSGYHKNTGEKRVKGNPSFDASYMDTKGKVFKKFKHWDKYPEWLDFKEVLENWEMGTKTYKDVYYVLKDVARRCGGNNKILENLDKINPKQNIFAEKQNCSFKEFILWYDGIIQEIPTLTAVESTAREAWLWVTAMYVVYGIRPSEIAAAQNLTKPWYRDGVTIPAINDPNNKNLLLVIGSHTYFGTSTKTGERIARPLVTDFKIIEKLRIQKPKLPIYKPSLKSKAKTLTNSFPTQLRNRLKDWNCPVTQAYAFRHLSNQLGEKYGIPQEIRSRSLGHSVAVNDRVYKKRSNLKTTIDLLTNHNKQALDYESAKRQLINLGIDINNESVQLILKIVYQLDD